MTKIILDTNVIFSALAFDKTLEELLVKVTQSDSFKLFRSLETSQEVANKLTHTKFLDYRKLNLVQVQEFLESYFGVTSLVEVTKDVKLSRDKADNKFLSLANTVDADYLITGDKDLLVLKNFNSTKILKPSQFLQINH